MAATYDRMIAADERRAQECEERELVAFRRKHDGRIDLALTATAERIRSETTRRREELIADVCEKVWKRVMGGEHTKVEVTVEIDDRDREYYNNMVTPLIKERLGLDAAAGGKAILEVKAYQNNHKPLTSGYPFLQVTLCPHP